ncbi:MAG: L-serine ammonia-lyase, iron-sulfur-dependent, subunit alpha [Syntrophales bacterium]
MKLLKKIFEHEVFPAVGCTEPISCAYATAAAAGQLDAPVEKIELIVDPGTFKNGAAVTIPNSKGRKGNLIAAVMGAIIARPELRLEILKEVSADILNKSLELIDQGAVSYLCKEDEKEFYIEAVLTGGASRVRCVVIGGHTNINILEKDGISCIGSPSQAPAQSDLYHDRMRNMKLDEVLREVINLDDEERSYIQRGIDMNLAIAEKGVDLKRNAYQLRQMMKQGLKADDLFHRVKEKVASAVDARMGGLPEPVMTSGGSGNQGVLTVLVPYLVGRHLEIELPRIQESIAVSHAVNSYIKSFTGELSVICGCAIAASISASLAVVYQQAGIDMEKMTYAIDNVIGDLCGIICDGAKSGCSMKIVTGAEAAMRSAFMALAGYGLSDDDGVLGRSAEESIRNLSKISLEGMQLVDSTVVHILQDKTTRSGQA